MGILKEAVSSELVLWGHLQFTDNITLDKMLEVISKWKSKTSKSDSNAVANYTALPGNLKKAYGKKQPSGRGSGKDQVARGVETRACLACAKVGHLVKDCKNKSAKDAWLAQRESRSRTRNLKILAAESILETLTSVVTGPWWALKSGLF